MPDETSRTEHVLTTAAEAVPDARSVNARLMQAVSPPEFTDAIEQILDDFLSAESASVLRHDTAIAPLVDSAKLAVLGGGKRVRPTFAYWGWRAVAGPDAVVDPVLPALAALELLHAFALVHDDVMDASPLRRGQPTTHVALATDHRRRRLRGDPGLFGTSVAILVGDLCLVWADRLLATAQLPGETLLAARRVYDLMRVEAIAGQFLDVLGDASRGWSVQQARLVDGLKTASYTVTRPLIYGMALAGEQPEHLPLRETFQRYGAAIGEAFQLRDDLLGVVGEPAVTGKPAGEDLMHGKPTVLVEIARERATPRQRSRLERRLSKGARVDVAAVARLLTDIGAISEVERMINERVESALAILAAAPLDSEVRRALATLARAATTRVA